MLPFFHRQITIQALGEAGFPVQTQKIIGETARWPDWFRWTDTTAHAQTPTDEQGQPQDSGKAMRDSGALLCSYLEKARYSSPNESAVWLGFALHLIQDLAVHQGCTQPEHSWQSFLLLPNPDWSPSGLRRGRHYTQQFIARLSQLVSAELLDKLRDGHQLRLLTPAEQIQLLGPKTFSWSSLFDFAKIAWRYGQRSPRPQVRWATDRVLAGWLDSLSYSSDAIDDASVPAEAALRK